MKRIISVVLVLAMLLGLCSCGAQSFAGDKLSADFKGAGSKKLTIVFHSEGLEIYSREAIVPTLEDGTALYTANLAKVKGNDVTYKLVGKNEGSATFSVIFTNPAGSTLDCTMTINVDSKKKISFSNLVFDDAPRYTDLDEKTKISYAEGFSKRIQLDGINGPWKVGRYDENIIDAVLDDVTDDYQYIFLVTAMGEGDSDLVLLCKETNEKVTFKFNVTKVPDEKETSGYRFILTLLDFEFGVYSKEDDPDYQNNRKSTLDTLNDLLGEDGAYIPGIGILDDSAYYNKDGKPLYDEDGNLIEENVDSAEMDLRIDGNKLDYMVSKSTTFQAECDDIESLDATEIKVDLPIKGDTVRYYFTTYGFGVAIWSQGKYVSRLVFMSEEQTDASNRKILYKFLGAEDEYKE